MAGCESRVRYDQSGTNLSPGKVTAQAASRYVEGRHSALHTLLRP